MVFLHKKWCFSASTSRLHYLLRLRRLHPLFVRVPVRFSDCSLTVPRHHVLVPVHHVLPQNEVAWARTVFSTVGCANLFLRLLCIHPAILHICSYAETLVITEHNFLVNHAKLSNKALPLESVMSSMYVFTQLC
jgi:hypothetical protein